VAAAAPGIFVYGNNWAIVQNQDYSLNGPSNPAKVGNYITLYGTGGGAVTPAVATGNAAPASTVSVTTLDVTASINGVPASVIFAGLTPGAVGLLHVDIQVPDLPSGTYPIQIREGGVNSNAPSVAIVSTVTSVDSSKFVTAAGVQASPGQVFTITATGTVNLADQDGPYVVDANGTIVTAPPAGSGAYNFFTNNAGPVGVAPVVGAQKLMISPYVAYVANQAYGALVAGFSSTPNPSAISDFPSGFTLVGVASSITAPSTGGYLFFASNDVNLTDNTGSFTVSITASTPANPAQVAPAKRSPSAATSIWPRLSGLR
jgi:hypothetical protein